MVGCLRNKVGYVKNSSNVSKRLYLKNNRSFLGIILLLFSQMIMIKEDFQKKKTFDAPFHSARLLFRSQRKSFPSRSDFRRHFPSIHQSSTLYSPGDAETFLSEERSFETSKAGKNLEPMIHAQITKPIFEHVTDNRIQANFRYFPIRRPTDFSLLRSIVSIESINCTLSVFCFLFSKTFDRIPIGRCIRMCLLQKE